MKELKEKLRKREQGTVQQIDVKQIWSIPEKID